MMDKSKALKTIFGALTIILFLIISVFLISCGNVQSTGQKDEDFDGNEIATISSVDGATIDGTNIYMFVDCTTDYVSLLDKITVTSGSWELYSDILGQNCIPTKIATGSNGVLADGENIFYIMLEDNKEALVAVYTLTIYRSYAITINYYNHKEVCVHTETAYTGYKYEADYVYSTEGYTFNKWKENGENYQSRILWADLSLQADMTVNSYTVNFDANGGILNQKEQKVTYDAAYTFPVPDREGFTFLGWFSDNIQLTDSTGQHISYWKYNNSLTATAKWKTNQYEVTAEYERYSGEIKGVGIYDYGSTIKLNALANLGYTFLGWYDGDDCLTTESSYSFALPAQNVKLMAKFKLRDEMQNYIFKSTLTSCSVIGVKDSSISELVIPDFVTRIEEGAFSGCNLLKSVSLPFVGGDSNALTASASTVFGYIFGSEKFDGGIRITQSYSESDHAGYYIPQSLKRVTITNGEILYGAFYGCAGLESIDLPNNVTHIGNNAFYGCAGLESIDLPDNVTHIGDSAFSDCSRLKSIELSDNVTYIGDSTFQFCYNLIDINIIEGVTHIGDYAFCGCSGLADIDIPNSVVYIGDCAFDGCVGLKNITISSGVTHIGYGAFLNCSGLTNVDIPNSVTYIGSRAFAGCSGLKSMVLPFVGNSIKSSSEQNQYPFGYIFGETQYTGSTLIHQRYYDKEENIPSTRSYYIPSNLESVTILSGSIFYGAFSRCSGLKSIKLPSGVKDIGAYAFEDCNDLTNITIPNGVTSIGDYAFIACQKLSSILLPDGVIHIGDNAFWGCSGLTSIDIPDGVTHIGDEAFSGCSGLTGIDIPDGVTHIGNGVFAHCSGLTSIDIPDGVIYIGDDAFRNCTSLTSIDIPDGVTHIGDGVFWGCSGLTSIDIPDGVIHIENNAFRGCTSLTSIDIPDGVTHIGNSTFWGCASLRDIIISDSVTSIDVFAFESCTSLTSIVIPGSITEINSYVFRNCSSLINVTILDGVTTIGESAFEGCISLESVTIPDSVTTIESFAFSDCSSLTGITIPGSVTSIFSGAFSECTSLTEAYFTDPDDWRQGSTSGEIIPAEQLSNPQTAAELLKSGISFYKK